MQRQNIGAERIGLKAKEVCAEDAKTKGCDKLISQSNLSMCFKVCVLLQDLRGNLINFIL